MPGWKYEFPAHHESHPEFKTEWWYFSGNLTAADGHEFGYQLAFFRQGVMPPDADIIPLSHFVTSSVKFAHFAVSDITGSAFHFFQKLSRGAYGEAGFGRSPRLAWIEDWSCTLGDDGVFRIQAKAGDLSLELHVESGETAGDSRKERREPEGRGRGEGVALLFVHETSERGRLARGKPGVCGVRTELVRPRVGHQSACRQSTGLGLVRVATR